MYQMWFEFGGAMAKGPNLANGDGGGGSGVCNAEY